MGAALLGQRGEKLLAAEVARYFGKRPSGIIKGDVERFFGPRG
jgi:hypothetical protein